MKKVFYCNYCLASGTTADFLSICPVCDSTNIHYKAEFCDYCINNHIQFHYSNDKTKEIEKMNSSKLNKTGFM